MKTTVDIPDVVYGKLKLRAAARGCSVHQLILRCVKVGLSGETARQGKIRISLPLIKSNTPGRLRLSNKIINEFILP